MLDQRNAFRIAVAVAGLVPVSAGLAGALLGVGLTDQAVTDIALDSHVRYLSGLLLGIGLMAWGTLRAPERHGALWNALTAIVFLGGLARLGGVAVHGLPPGGMAPALVMELVVTPTLWAWRRRLFGSA